MKEYQKRYQAVTIRFLNHECSVVRQIQIVCHESRTLMINAQGGAVRYV